MDPVSGEATLPFCSLPAFLIGSTLIGNNHLNLQKQFFSVRVDPLLESSVTLEYKKVVTKVVSLCKMNSAKFFVANYIALSCHISRDCGLKKL